MTRSCLLCGRRQTQDSDRSFHRFPSDVEMRQRWMKVVGLSYIPKFAVLCSDHFDKTSVCSKIDSPSARKYLVPNAMPRLKLRIRMSQPPMDGRNVPDLSISSENSQQAFLGALNLEQRVPNRSSIEYDGSRTIRSSIDGEVWIENHEEDQPSDEAETFSSNTSERSSTDSDRDSGSGGRKLKQMELADPLSLASQDFENSGHGDHLPNRLEYQQLPVDGVIQNSGSCVTPNDDSNDTLDREQKRSSKPPKRIRFKTDTKKDYMTRADFVSDEAWERFLEFVAYKNSRIDAAREKCSKRKIKVHNLKQLIRGIGDDTAAAATPADDEYEQNFHFDADLPCEPPLYTIDDD